MGLLSLCLETVQGFNVEVGLECFSPVSVPFVSMLRVGLTMQRKRFGGHGSLIRKQYSLRIFFIDNSRMVSFQLLLSPIVFLSL